MSNGFGLRKQGVYVWIQIIHTHGGRHGRAQLSEAINIAYYSKQFNSIIRLKAPLFVPEQL